MDMYGIKQGIPTGNLHDSELRWTPGKFVSKNEKSPSISQLINSL